MNTGDVTKDADARRFVLDIDGNKAFIDYRVEGGVYHLLYSEVPPALRGAGIGKVLVEKTFEAIAAEEKTAVAHCSYIRYISRRSDRWADIVTSGSGRVR